MKLVTNDDIIENYFESFKLLYNQFLKDASQYGPFREKHFNNVEQLANNNVIMMISENQPVGFVAYNFQEDELFISSLYVIPEMRNRGIASELLQRIPNNDKKPKVVYCYSDNQIALAFYEKIGFREFFKGLYKSM